MTWKSDLLAVIHNHWTVGEQFTIWDLYGFEQSLRASHPNVRDVRSKIRQTLQNLRDDLLVEFRDNTGTYALRR